MTDKPIERHYSDALDEVYRLRGLLAYHALGIRAHLEYKTFPKSRRAIAEGQVAAMQAAARGESQRVMAGLPNYQPKHALREAGASETLTRYQFEEQQ